MLNSNGARTDPWGTPFLSLRSRPCCPPLVPSTKLRPETSPTMKCTICLSGSIRRSFRVTPRCHTVSYAAVRSTRTAPAVSLASKQSLTPCVSRVTWSTVDRPLRKPACSWGSWDQWWGWYVHGSSSQATRMGCTTARWACSSQGRPWTC